MWARRLGCPPLWPSRVKVLIMSYLLVGCVFTFFDFLRNADADYLELNAPRAPGLVTCGLTQPLCRDKDDPLGCILREHEPIFGGVDLQSAMPGHCSAPPKEEECIKVSHPLTGIQGELGKLHTVHRMLHPLRAWAWLYLWLMILLCSSIIIHDLALLQGRCRPKILSIRSAKQEMPLLWSCISSLQCVGPMHEIRRRSCFVWVAIQPVWFVFQVAIFLTIVYPLSLFAGIFWWCPLGAVRVSRVMVFQSGALSLFWSLIFVLASLLSPALAGSDMYALFWHAKSQQHGCVCYCEYPLRGGVESRLIFFGIIVCAWSASISFRALKGLRRPNWGNLFSILYTVPIEAFPVEWERPDEAGGGPIDFRKPGEAVQSEPAFDPFCLMDEQPESGRTRVQLFPVLQSQKQQAVWSRCRDPTSDSAIGCCGFPMTMQTASTEVDVTDDLEKNKPNASAKAKATEGREAAALRGEAAVTEAPTTACPDAGAAQEACCPGTARAGDRAARGSRSSGGAAQGCSSRIPSSGSFAAGGPGGAASPRGGRRPRSLSPGEYSGSASAADAADVKLVVRDDCDDSSCYHSEARRETAGASALDGASISCNHWGTAFVLMGPRLSA